MKIKKEISIYEVHLPKNLCVKEIEGNLSILSDEEREVYNNYKVNDKKVEFLIGRLLIKHLISENLGISVDEVKLMKNKFGKLFIEKECMSNGKESLNFNLSHTEGMVVCVIGFAEEIGVDVENVTYDFLDVMPQVFLSEEIKYIKTGSLYKTNILRFFHVWTKKEALMKAKGLGFSLSPLSFSVPYHLNECIHDDFQYHTYSPKSDHMVSVAVAVKNTDGLLYSFTHKEIDWKDLLKKDIS